MYTYIKSTKGKVYHYFHIVHFKGTSVLYLPKFRKIQHTWANTAHLPNTYDKSL